MANARTSVVSLLKQAEELVVVVRCHRARGPVLYPPSAGTARERACEKTAIQRQIGATDEQIDKLVYAFYTPGFSFATFVSQHPEYRPQLIQLLIGGVFKEPIRDIFEAMRGMCDIPEDIPLESSPPASI